MRVRAIAFGECRGKRKPGDEFEFDGKPSGKWMEPVDDAAREAFKKAGFKVAPTPAKLEEPKGKGKGKGDAGTPAVDGKKSTGDQEVI